MFYYLNTLWRSQTTCSHFLSIEKDLVIISLPIIYMDGKRLIFFSHVLCHMLDCASYRICWIQVNFCWLKWLMGITDHERQFFWFVALHCLLFPHRSSRSSPPGRPIEGSLVLLKIFKNVNRLFYLIRNQWLFIRNTAPQLFWWRTLTDNLLVI